MGNDPTDYLHIVSSLLQLHCFQIISFNRSSMIVVAIFIRFG